MPPRDPVRKPLPRMLQQQPARDSDPQQQRAGGTDFQPRGGARLAVPAGNDPEMEQAGREARARRRDAR